MFLSVYSYVPRTEYLQSLKRALEQVVERFFAEQVAWVALQKGDPKRGISACVPKVASLVYQVLCLMGKQVSISHLLVEHSSLHLNWFADYRNPTFCSTCSRRSSRPCSSGWKRWLPRTASTRT